MNKKGFTLIELLAVLVVLAILALISVPITIRIINNARENSYKRSIANYGNVFREVIAMDNMENASNDYKPLSSYVAKVEKMYTGNRVQCNLAKSKLENGKLQLVGCIIVKEVQENYDNSKNIAQYDYIYNNGLVSKPEYDYHIGDTFTLNGDSYHIIADSLNIDDYVVALKDRPLSLNAVNTYGGVGTASNKNGYGGMVYYSSSTCGRINGENITTGCTTSYDQSDVKYVVDAWAQAKFTNELKTVDGYSTRLIKYDEFAGLGYEWKNITPSDVGWVVTNNVPSWVYNRDYWYWTMSKFYDSFFQVWIASNFGPVYGDRVSDTGTVRPVINVYKSKLPS